MDRQAARPSQAEAAARLRYVSGVRTRTRRALLLPSFAVPVGLGAVIAVHGLVLALAPPGEAVSVAWIAGLVATRPLLRWRARRGRSAHILAADRLLAACVVAGVAAAIAAMVASVSPMVSCIAAATGVRALLAGMPVAGLVALATGLVADALLLQGAAPAMVELMIGTVLIVAGLVWRGMGRQS